MPSMMERAFEIARSGKVATMSDLRTMLRREGFTQIEAHLSGALTKKQLSELMGIKKGRPVRKRD